MKNNAFNFVIISLLTVFLGACNATGKNTGYSVKNINFSQLPSNIVNSINTLQNDNSFSSNAAIALKVGFENNLNRSCQSLASIDLQKTLMQALTSAFPQYRFPAFNDVNLVASYKYDEQFEASLWQVDYLLVAHFDSVDIQYNATQPSVNFKIIKVNTNQVIFTKNYHITDKKVGFFLNPIKCQCNKLCTQEKSLFTQERITGAFKQLNKCELSINTQLLTLPSCKSEIMSSSHHLDGSIISSKFFKKKCNRCGGNLPSYESLDSLRLCTPIDQRGMELPCLFKGEVSLCHIGISSVAVTELSEKKRKFTSLQCEFSHQ